MKKVKDIIRCLLGKKILNKIKYSKKISKNSSKINLVGTFFKVKIFNDKKKNKLYEHIFKKLNICIPEKDENFYYNIDIYIKVSNSKKTINNLTVDYNLILENSLQDLKNKIISNEKNEEFCNDEINLIEAINIYIDRICKKIDNNNIESNLKRIKNNKAESFYDALQRILFFNQLLWQTNHPLMGLGRLDNILSKYYEDDIKKKILSKEEARMLLKEFIKDLHKFYNLKSRSILGDTGQIIILGGKDSNGNIVCNELTYLFIELIKEINLPDPKILLRVSKDTPKDLIELSLKCIQTGIGCPLFANDDVIIPKLIEFGYSKEEAFDYCTSACWEPDVVGKSIYLNNISSISFMAPLENMLNSEDLYLIKNVDKLLENYKKYLEEYLIDVTNEINTLRFEKDCLLSLFTTDCMKNNIDISEGGAKYNNFGLTGVGIGNTVNSIVNIIEFVFNKKEITLEELNNARKNNFENNEELLAKLKNQPMRYGTDNNEIIELSNEIIKYATEILEKKKNIFGGTYKFGLSSPAYIDLSKDLEASFDGRKVGEPFGVHISSDLSNGYTELMQFASKLDYGQNRINGNVVDYFVTPNFIEQNFDKFVNFLMISIRNGFYEMQMNVVSSQTLIEARKNPNKFPNLIVRVWGFSAYFKDLPDEYKDYLIERALNSEGN